MTSLMIDVAKELLTAWRDGSNKQNHDIQILLGLPPDITICYHGKYEQ